MDFVPHKLQIALMAIALFLGGYWAHSFVARGADVGKGIAPPALSRDEIAEGTLEYVEKFLEPEGIEGRLLGVGEYGDDLYQVNLSLRRDGFQRNATLWVTRDGRLILLGDGVAIIHLLDDVGEGEETKEKSVPSTEPDPYKGRVDAPITIVEYSDFQCPYCQSFWQETLPRIQSEYIDKGLVKLVLRDFPLSSIHPYAQKAAEAAQCAYEQGKFWEYHDKLFTEFRAWQREGTDEFKRIAKDLGLDEARFGACIDSGKYASVVQRDLQDGIKAGVSGTPAFFVDGVKVEGAQPFSAFQQVIEAQLNRKATEPSLPKEETKASTGGIDISDAAYAFGPENARVVMIEFNDYQCPFCKRFRDQTLDILLQQYGDNMRYVFMDFPITSIHPQAFVAHLAARCAGDQGKYTEYHDKLFANQRVWSRFAPESKEEFEELKSYARELGLNSDAFDKCLEGRVHAEKVVSSLQKGVDAGVTGTPSFFINGQKVVGAQPLSVFQGVIEAQLK